VSKWFAVDGRLTQAIDRISLAVAEGEFVSIVGPSGCGKTTLFNIICGILAPDEGEVFVDGQPATGRRGLVAYMPQRDALLPWRTVLQNVLLGAELGGQPMAQARAEALSLLPAFGLAGYEHRYPYELSGGMRQRAALLRTYMLHRDVLLLDEPFGALDALTRRQLQLWLLELYQQHRKTVLFITHDVDEAVFLSDRIYALTPRPARICCTLEVDLPRPRTFAAMAEPRFTALRQELLRALQVI
jgi:ABC-type nitrate/sulfonate/bicarbonate transport system ATPase subunit